MDSLIVTSSSIFLVDDGIGDVLTLGTGFTEVLTDVAMDSEGNIYVLGFDTLYRVTDLDNAGLAPVMSFHGEDANALAFGSDGMLYVGFGNDNRIDIVDVESALVVDTFDLPGTVGTAGDVEVRGNWLYASMQDDRIVTVDLRTGSATSVDGDLIGITGLSWGEDGLLGYSGETAFRVFASTGNTLPLAGLAVSGPILGASQVDGQFEVFGTDGADSLVGSVFDDTIRGYEGNDTLVGQESDDVLNGGLGADVLRGGAGRDTASYVDATRSVRVDLQNSAYTLGEAVGDTFDSIEIFQTGNGVDQLRGDAGDNEFYTGASSDRLYGRAGDDTMDGERGADALYGGRGVDVMTGGTEDDFRDRFIYFNIEESGVGVGNRDIITDFVSGEDRIEISRFDANIYVGLKQSFTFIGAGGLDGRAGDLAYVHENGNTIVQLDNNGDGAADFEIELIGIHTLTADDFLI